MLVGLQQYRQRAQYTYVCAHLRFFCFWFPVLKDMHKDAEQLYSVVQQPASVAHKWWLTQGTPWLTRLGTLLHVSQGTAKKHWARQLQKFTMHCIIVEEKNL